MYPRSPGYVEAFEKWCTGEFIVATNSWLEWYSMTGHALDILARVPLWKDGLDYRHGTGHGVGSYLNVHEGKFTSFLHLYTSVQCFVSKPVGWISISEYNIGRLINFIPTISSRWAVECRRGVGAYMNHLYQNIEFACFEYNLFPPFCKQDLIL